jgi:hypothetical protein
MDKRRFVKAINELGNNIKTSDIYEIKVVSEKKNVNSANTDLYTVEVSTSVGVFTFQDELVPNKYGSTAFSTETTLGLVKFEELETKEEETEIGESVTDGSASEDM